MSNNSVQPIFILPEETKRTSGKDAQRNNIAAAKAVAQAVRTTLGPKGMDKMIVDANGDVTVTNDGVTILREMQIEHPAAKMVVEIAKTLSDWIKIEDLYPDFIYLNGLYLADRYPTDRQTKVTIDQAAEVFEKTKKIIKVLEKYLPK